MATQTQGKGKKKNKEVTKVSLDEFNSIDAPHGHSVVSIKVTGLDWAATMAHHDMSTDTQQIVVPVAPRAQRGPNVDFDAISDQPPFRASLYNLPMSVDEGEIADRFFQGINVVRVDLSSKASTTVEFETKNDLYEALCKDGSSFKGKTVNVCLFGQAPRNEYDRYGGRGSSSYGDRYERGPGGGFGPKMGFNDRSGGFGGSRMGYGERSGGFGGPRSGYGERSSGFGGNRAYGDGFQDRGSFADIRGSYSTAGGEQEPREEPDNWRDRPAVKPAPLYNNGSRQPYMQPRSEPTQYQPPSQQYHHNESYQQSRYQHHNQPLNHSPPPLRGDRLGSKDRVFNPPRPSAIEERPKLVLKMRDPVKPINVEDVVRNESIFGKAKPSSTPYQKMREVEEKLQGMNLSDQKTPSQSGSQTGSQPGSAPRSRQISERSRD